MEKRKQTMSVSEISAAIPYAATDPRREFWQGIRDTVPLMISAASFGLIFGALAVTNGVSPLATTALSLFVFAGSAEFVAITLLAAGVSTPLIILTTFVVNLRHALYGLTLGPFLKTRAQKWLLPLGFFLTDETFAVTSAHNQKQPSPYLHWYQLGSSLAMYINWNFWTVVGIIAGSQIADPSQLGLQFSLVVTFIGFIVPAVKTRPMLVAVFVSAGTALVTYNLPNKLFLVISALAGITAGLIAESVLPKGQSELQEEPSTL